MMRGLFLLLLSAFACPVEAGDFWSNLWTNADRQGEQLLQQGDASAAAKVYADPRRKAYAKLQAGDFAGAASDLGNLHDSESDYNRGTALAQTGDLQGALQAFDAALKSDPKNQDARHNRELVAKALEQQAQQQQKSGENKSGDNKSGDNKSGQGKQDGQQGKDSSGQSENNSGKDASGQSKAAEAGADRRKSGDEKSSEGKQGGNAGQSGEQATKKDDAAQARRDAEASLAKAEKNGNEDGKVGENALGDQRITSSTPKSEQQIAQEQWLRSIPDDPGGLLRRKFLVEHMIRQQKAQQ